MKLTVPQIPDYQRLCEFSRRVPALDPEAVYAVATVHAVGAELAGAMQASLGKHGMTEGRLRVLAKLMDRDRPMTHSELADCCGVTKGTITGLVDGLERDGYVERQAEPNDRRVMMIELTQAGRSLLDRILPGHLARLSKMVSGLTRDEQRQLVELLKKVREGLPALPA